ncbi:MAG: HIT domain-containing protein [Rhizobiaceae bacterium]|nr:HIT domain-containing protein [Rhizobiaceae bacterium]
MPSYDDTNVFARILRGEIPCHKVYEDADTLAFMDVMPMAQGHCLVIPKSASRNLLDADPAVVAKVATVAQRLAIAAKAAFACDGVTVFQFNEAAAGQTVYHLHFHVVPRIEGVALKQHTGQMEKPDILSANAERLRAALA